MFLGIKGKEDCETKIYTGRYCNKSYIRAQVLAALLRGMHAYAFESSDLISDPCMRAYVPCTD